jgi:hypothetical protein
MSARSVNSVGMLRSTSPGLGSTTGDTIRVSGVAPNVSAHQTRMASPTPTAPTARLMSGGGASRSVKRRRPSDGDAVTGTAVGGGLLLTASLTGHPYFDSSG